MNKRYPPKNKLIEHEIYILMTAKIRAEGLPNSEYHRILREIRAEEYWHDAENTRKSHDSK